jgi:hypothetical protein
VKVSCDEQRRAGDSCVFGDRREWMLLLRQNGISSKSIITALVFLLVLIYVGTRSHLYGLMSGIPMEGIPQGAIAFMVVLIGVNSLSRRIRGTNVFSRAELTVIYAVGAVGGVLSGYAFVKFGISAIMGITSHAFYLDPGVARPLSDQYSSLVLPKNASSIYGFWQGQASVPWMDWILPILFWSFYYLLLYWLFLCCSSLVRRHWEDQQHLSYPFATPVVSVVNDLKSPVSGETSLWKSTFARIVALYPIVYLGLRGLNKYYPVVPRPDINVDLGGFFTDGFFQPLSALQAKLQFTLDPLELGIGLLLPIDMLFSVWFFALTVVGLGTPIYFSFLGGSANKWTWMRRWVGVGAWGILVPYSLWLARANIREMCRQAIYSGRNDNRSDEMLSPRAAIWGGLAGLVLLLCINWFIKGFSFWMGICWLLYLLVISLASARLRVEGAFQGSAPYIYPSPMNSGADIYAFTKHVVAPRDYVSLSMTAVPMDYGFLGITGYSLDALKVGSDAGVKKKVITCAMIIGVGFSLLAAWVIALPLIYKYGFNSADGWAVWAGKEIVRPMIRTGSSPVDWSILYYPCGGAIGTLFLSIMHTNFAWWPFHPVAFALQMGEIGHWSAGPFLIAWLVKTLAIRWGGGRFVSRITEAGYTLIVASVGMRLFWVVVALIVGR